MTPAVCPTYIILYVPFVKHAYIHIFLKDLAFKYLYSSGIIMHAATCLLALLCASSAVASTAIDAFKRVDRVLEPRAAAQHNAPVHSQERRLQKRASPFLNNVTQSDCANKYYVELLC